MKTEVRQQRRDVWWSALGAMALLSACATTPPLVPAEGETVVAGVPSAGGGEAGGGRGTGVGADVERRRPRHGRQLRLVRAPHALPRLLRGPRLPPVLSGDPPLVRPLGLWRNLVVGASCLAGGAPHPRHAGPCGARRRPRGRGRGGRLHLLPRPPSPGPVGPILLRAGRRQHRRAPRRGLPG